MIEIEENTQLSFWSKKSKDQATNLPWRNLSLFSSQLGSAEENPERFIEGKVCFETGVYQLALCYWLFRACLHGGGRPQVGEVTRLSI